MSDFLLAGDPDDPRFAEPDWSILTSRRNSEVERSRWSSVVPARSAAYTATGIRTPEPFPLVVRNAYRGAA